MRTVLKTKWFLVPGWMISAIAVVVMGHGLIGQARAATPATTPATAPAQTTQLEGVSFLQMLLKGGYFMLPIALASLIGLALILERVIALRKGRIIPRGFMRKLKSVAPEGSDQRAAALRFCQENPSPIARVMAAGLRKLPQGHAAVERAIEDQGGAEVHKLRRNMRLLYGVSVVAPLMGLLGTVWGMIEAFRVTSSQQGLGKPELLAKGIYEALVCTMAGLMVAIPVLMLYYFFASKIERYVAEMNDVSLEFTDHFLEEKSIERKEALVQ